MRTVSTAAAALVVAASGLSVGASTAAYGNEDAKGQVTVVLDERLQRALDEYQAALERLRRELTAEIRNQTSRLSYDLKRLRSDIEGDK